MKTIINNTLIISMMLISNIGFSQSNNKSMDSFTVQVDGLGCPFCAYGLEKKFKELNGMKKASIDMETGIFTFDFPSPDSLTIEQVQKQVEKAGYTPIQVEIIRSNGKPERSEKQTAQNNNPDGESKQISFKVEGNCGMCKARIEKAANSLDGVTGAFWDENTKQLSMQVSENTSTQTEIERAIAAVGHNTENQTSSSKVYSNLPACCKYK